MTLNESQKLMRFKFCAYGFLKNLRFFEPFLLLFFTIEKGLSYTQFGALVAVREVSVYLLEIPTGIVADMTGRRRAMVMAFSSYLFSFAIFSLAEGFWLFAAAMVLFGAGEALRSGTHKSMIMQHLDLEGLSHLKVDYYGTTRAMSRLGSAASVLISGAVVFAVNSYQVVFLASMAPYVLGLLLMLTYPPALDGQVVSKLSLKAFARHTADSFRGIWRTRELLKVLLNASTANSFFKVAKDYLQPILKDAAAAIALAVPLFAFADSPTKRAAILIAVVYFAIHLNEFFSSRYSGRLARRVGHLGKTMNMLFWGFAAAFCLAGVCLRVNALAVHPVIRQVALAVAVLMLLFFYTLNNLRMPIVTGLLSEKAKPQQRATILSVHSQLRAVIAAAVAPAFGLIADHLGIPFAFLIGGGVLMVAGVALRLGTRPEGLAAQAAGPADTSE